MRRPTAVLPLSAAALLLVGCSTSADTVGEVVGDVAEEAQDTVEEGLQRLEWCTDAFRLGQAVQDRDLDAGRAALAALQESAPEELDEELATIAAAADQAEQGDLQAIESDEVRAAGEEVLATARAQCDPTTRPE